MANNQNIAIEVSQIRKINNDLMSTNAEIRSCFTNIHSVLRSLLSNIHGDDISNLLKRLDSIANTVDNDIINMLYKITGNLENQLRKYDVNIDNVVQLLNDVLKRMNEICATYINTKNGTVVNPDSSSIKRMADGKILWDSNGDGVYETKLDEELAYTDEAGINHYNFVINSQPGSTISLSDGTILTDTDNNATYDTELNQEYDYTDEAGINHYKYSSEPIDVDPLSSNGKDE